MPSQVWGLTALARKPCGHEPCIDSIPISIETSIKRGGLFCTGENRLCVNVFGSHSYFLGAPSVRINTIRPTDRVRHRKGFVTGVWLNSMFSVIDWYDNMTLGHEQFRIGQNNGIHRKIHLTLFSFVATLGVAVQFHVCHICLWNVYFPLLSCIRCINSRTTKINSWAVCIAGQALVF